MSVIHLDQLTKYYGKNKGIENLSLTVDEGDIYGFIGPNGAGKSTTIRLMMNFIFPSSGDVHIFDKNVIKHAEIIKKDIGYIPSEVYFYKTLKVMDLLNYAYDLKGATDRTRLQYLIDAFDLDINRKFGELSFGNKKKVSIVQALLHRPKLLILDEPTNGLDPLVQKTLLEIIKEEHKTGTTVFFSSHTLSVVQKMCNRIGIIKDGEMLSTETYESMKEKRIKKVTIEANEILHVDHFAMKAIDQLNVDGNRAEFYYHGQMNVLFKMLDKIEIQDFTMSDPELEEIFMHYYSEGGDLK